jgi:hypothetical protein
MRFSPLLILTALACAPAQPRLVPLSPEQVPAEWETWYHQLEACSGKKGDWGGLAIYITPSHYRFGHHFDGYWQEGGIVINDHFVKDKELVEHEMMHDLIKSDAHPREFFKSRCGDLSLGEVPE